jgi:hypothetical protein
MTVSYPNSRLIVGFLFFASAINSQAQVTTTGNSTPDCKSQSPRILLNSNRFKIGDTAVVTVQGSHAGVQTIYVGATGVQSNVIPGGQNIGLGSVVSYLALNPNTHVAQVTTDPSGTGQFSLPIGNNPSLVGQNFHFQAFALSHPNCSASAGYSSSALRTVQVKASSGAPIVPTFVNSVTKGSITWFFDRPVEVGTYANGDFWAKAPFIVTSITPTPANGRNGSMVDPNANPTVPGTQVYQAYDSRGTYNASLAANASSLNFTDITSIKSLVSTVSTPDSSTFSLVAELQVLTVIPNSTSSPTSQHLRPSYHQGQKLNISLNELVEEPETLFSFLQNNPAYASSMPALSGMQSLTSRSTYLVAGPGWGANSLNGTFPGYGVSFSDLTGRAALYALHSGAQNRREIWISLLQMGIDIWGVVANGGSLIAFRGDGGQMNGRKLPLVLLAKSLINGSQKNLVYNQLAQTKFSEDDQIRVGTGANLPWFNPHTGTAFYFNKDQAVDPIHPATLTSDAQVHPYKYKFCCTYIVAGGPWLAVNIIKGWDAWENGQTTSNFKVGVHGYYSGGEDLLSQYNTLNYYKTLLGGEPLGPASWFIDSQGRGTHQNPFVRDMWNNMASQYAP